MKIRKKILALFLVSTLLFAFFALSPADDNQKINSYLTTNIFADFFKNIFGDRAKPNLPEINIKLPNIEKSNEKKEDKMKLTFVSPQKGAEDISGKSPLTFLFSKSVFSLENPETVANKLKEQIKITPKIEGSWQILGTSGILFEPKNHWENSTHYEIVIPKELVETEITHDFFTPKIRLRGLRSYDLINKKPITLSFSQKVDLDEIQTIRFKPSLRFDTEYVINKNGTKTEKDIKIIPRENWVGDIKFTLTIPKGFSSAEGEQKTETDVYRDFRTIADFKTVDWDQPNDVFDKFHINFTTPVSTEEFIEHLEISPKPSTKVWENYLKKITKDNYDKAYFSLPPIGKYWDPTKTYEIKISDNLVDIYDRKIKKDFSQTFSTKFPTTFRQVFLPSHNSVLKPNTEFNPTFWYSGNIVKINVDISETLTQKKKYSKTFEVAQSPNKEQFWTLNLKENFPEIFDENYDLFAGKYEIKVKAIKDKQLVTDLLDQKFNRDNYWYPQEHNTTFYISEFVVNLKQLPQQQFEIKTSSYPGEDKLSETFSYEIYNRKSYDANYFGHPVEKKENISNNSYITPQNNWDFEILVRSGKKIGFGSVNFTKGMNVYESGVSINKGFYERDQERFIGFSDRPLYKPGQKLYFKSIFRNLNTKGKTFPIRKVNFLTEKKFTLDITDPRWNRLDTIELSGNDGSVDGYWEIPEDAPHGNYRFKIKSNGKNLGDFQVFVGEYRKSNFLLDGDFDKKEAFYKEDETIKINANFAFGGALKNRPVNYRIILEGQHDCFWRYFDFGGGCGSKEKELAQGEGILDSNGEFQKPIDLDFKIDEKDPVWNNLKFRATVRDGDTEENSLEKSIPFYMSSEKLTLDRSSYYFEKKSIETISGEITDWENKIKSNKKILVKLSKIKPKRYYAELDSDVDESAKADDIVFEGEIISDEFGKFVINFTTPEKAGNYELTFLSIDGKERKTEISKIFWIPGVDDKNIRLKDENKILPLILDKETYEVGEDVEVFMPHSQWEITSARATLERGEILTELPVNLNNQTITFKTEEWMVPNVYVSVILEGKDENNNPQIKWGIADIPIINTSQKLDIDIIPDKKTYKPGESASFEIKTKAGGEYIPAELTVMIVDETLLSLKSRQKSDLLKVFLARLPLGVSLSNTIANFISQDQINAITKQIKNMELIDPNDDQVVEQEMMMDSMAAPMAVRSLGAMRTKSMAVSGMLNESVEDSNAGGEALVATPRDNFQDTAKFIGKIYTDSDGTANFDFELPDNLTTWNIYIVGHTEDNNFGSTDASIKTKLPLLISELVPNFFQIGDEVEVGVLIRRDTEDIPSEMVEVTLQLPEGFTTPARTKEIEISEEGRVFFPLTIVGEDYDMREDYHKVKFGFTVKGKSSKLTDGITLERKLFPPKVTLTAAEFLRVEIEELLKIKPDLERAITSKVIVKVFLSLAEKLGTLVDVADTRNYGCAEQRFSHSTAILMQKDFDNKIGRKSKPINSSYLKKNKDYIEKAFISDGGFAFWKHESSASFWVTTQILEFADLWKKYNAEIDPQKIKLSQKWLKKELLKKCDKKDDWKNCFSDTTRQNAAYVLARAKSNYISSRDLNQLSKYTHSLESKIWWLKTARILKSLNISLLKSDEKLIESFWTEIESHLKARDRYVFWEEDKDYWSFYSQNERLTSLVFEEILFENKLENHKHKIARYLSEAKIKDLSGNTALRLLQSLGNYAKEKESKSIGSEYYVGVIDSDVLEEGTLENLDSESEFIKDVTGDSEFKGLTFKPKNQKQFYADVVLQETFPAGLVAPVSRGFWIQRAIYDVNDDEFETPLNSLKLGENYVVRLKVVTNTSHRQIMIEDKIPSGAEFVNFEFENTNKELEKYAAAGRYGGITPYGEYEDDYMPRHCWGWCRPTFDHQEFHAEKARYFANYLTPGTYEIKYVIKTRLPGRFEVLPAKVEEMYYPEVFATTKGESVIIEKE